MTDLVHDLNQRANAVAVGAKRDVLAAALEAARAPRGSRRGWSLVRLAAALRDHGRYDEALSFLDLAECDIADDEVSRAAFTCAIAVHCDRDSVELANRLCDEQRRSMPGDERFLRAEIRARALWLEETGESAALEARNRAQSELDLLLSAATTLQVAVAPSQS